MLGAHRLPVVGGAVGVALYHVAVDIPFCRSPGGGATSGVAGVDKHDTRLVGCRSRLVVVADEVAFVG